MASHTKLIMVTIFALTIAPLPPRPVFLPFVAASCQPSLLHEETFVLQYDKTRFIVDQNPCSNSLQKRHFEINDTHPEGEYTDWHLVSTSFTVYRTEVWGNGHWRTVQRVEFRDFHFPFSVGAYRAG